MKESARIVMTEDGRQHLVVEEENKTTITSNQLALTPEGLAMLTAMTTIYEIGPFRVVNHEKKLQKI